MVLMAEQARQPPHESRRQRTAGTTQDHTWTPISTRSTKPKRGLLANTLLCFDLEAYQVPLGTLMPSKRIPDGVMSTPKYQQIVSSIHEIGLIEPLSVIQYDSAKPEFILLDGHLHVLVLKDLGMYGAPA